MSPDSLQPVLTTKPGKPLVHINYREKMVHELLYFTTCNWFFCIQDFCTQIFQVKLAEYQGQTRKTRILERKPLINTSYCNQHRLELKHFSFAQFLLNAHQAAHQPWKVRTDNFKFRTYVRDWVLDGWSVTQKINVYEGGLLKKSSNRKLKLVLSTLVTTWLSNITFHLLLIWLQTLVTINSESRLTSFPSFCVPPSEVALCRCTVQFKSEQTPFSQTGDLLLCTRFDSEHAVLFLCHILTQRPINDRKIELSNGCGLSWQQLLTAESRCQFHLNFIPHEKKVTLCCPKFTKH